jgi:hypothetical protein
MGRYSRKTSVDARELYFANQVDCIARHAEGLATRWQRLAAELAEQPPEGVARIETELEELNLQWTAANAHLEEFCAAVEKLKAAASTAVALVARTGAAASAVQPSRRGGHGRE